MTDRTHSVAHDAPADIAQAYGVPDAVCRKIARDHLVAALADRLADMAERHPELITPQVIVAVLRPDI